MGMKLNSRRHVLACGKEWMNLAFGATSSPYGKNNPHSGIDLVRDDQPYATDKVVALFGGRVSRVQTGYPNRGDMTLKGSAQWGNMVEVDCGGGTLLYAHLASVSVKKNQDIVAGQVLGYMGTSGMSTGLHLHLGVSKNGEWVDPLPYLNGQSIYGEPMPESTGYKKGDKVKIKQGAEYYSRSSVRIPARYKGRAYTVMQTDTDDMLIKELYSWVKTKDLEPAA
jgi:hypothetical protein